MNNPDPHDFDTLAPLVSLNAERLLNAVDRLGTAAVAKRLDLSPFTVRLAEMLLELYADTKRDLSAPFRFSELFLPGELVEGAADLLPGWFLTPSTAHDDPWNANRYLSQQFRLMFGRELLAAGDLQGTVIRCKDRQLPPAHILRAAGFDHPAFPVRLKSLDDSADCVVSALGDRYAFGYWLQLPAYLQPGQHVQEGRLLLNRHDWKVC